VDITITATRGKRNVTKVIEKPRVAPGAVRWQLAVVSKIVEITPRIKSFFFTLSRPFAFRAGQHVDIRLTAAGGYRAERSYSIASAPEHADDLELAIEKVSEGEVSSFFHDVARVGDTIELRGPIGGYFVWDVADRGPLFLLGGGSGIVPLMSMLRHRRAKKSMVPTLLLVSSRTWTDVPFRDELLQYAMDDPSFKLVFAITREPARRPGDYMRRIDSDVVREILGKLPESPRAVFICGANAFVNAGADGAVAAGIPAALIRTERYGGL
jgi:ferredoxin-NADP reductase